MKMMPVEILVALGFPTRRPAQPCQPHRDARHRAGQFGWWLWLGLLLAGVQPGRAYTHSGNIYTTDGSFADTQAAVGRARNGSIIQLPAGNFTWGHKRDRLYLARAVTLQGAGTNQTIITLPHDSQDYYGNGVITFMAPATVKNLQIAASDSPATAFTGAANGWRITGVLCDNRWGPYYVQTTGYGLIDHCTFVGANGSDEMIFCYGPANSWQTLDSLGTTNAVVIEDCRFTGSGYVCDANANARIVVRFCTITGPIKIDGHGVASDTPPRAVRQMEAYDNHWTSKGQGGAWDSLEIRGGTGIFFNNAVDDNTFLGRGIIQLKEYGCLAAWPNFGKVFQTPKDYPIKDQVGVGKDPKAGGSDPAYLWNNTKAGAPQTLSWAEIPGGALAQYAGAAGQASATFTMQDLIKADRDYFNQTTGSFDGSTGVGIGSKAQMLAITATKLNVGFWVTNEGSWNTTLPPDTSGRLYTWNGGAWALKYTPLTYPHPAAR
jgi:hypothetical protein